jgi:hypothetical protein
MKAKNIIWGLVLVLIGVLFILKNLDIIYFSWYSIWKLWPLALVLVGVAILPIKDVFKVVLTVVVLVAATIFLVTINDPGDREESGFFHGFRNDPDISQDPVEIDQRIFEAYDTSITEAYLTFDAAAGNFKIIESTGDLFEFERDGNFGRYNYSIKELGPRRDINIELEEGRVITGDMRNKAAIKLNPDPVWDLKVDVGAANVEMDLSAFKVSGIKIDGGASSINIVIGNLSPECKLKINSGASSINIRVPESFACEVNTSTVLSSKDLPGFNKVSNGTYVTPDFSSQSKNIVIDVEAAVSSLIIERY